MVSSEVVKTSFRIPKELQKRVKLFCVQTEKTETEVVSEALEEYLQKHGEELEKSIKQYVQRGK